MSEFEVIRTDTNEKIDDLHDIEIVDTANPFGNEAITVHADFEGDKFETLTRGVPIQINAGEFVPPSGDPYGEDYGGTYSSETEFESRFFGYIVEVDERDQSGERLEIQIYSLDQLLRSGEVSNDQTGNTIFDALEDIITTDTSVTWEPANVSVGDEQELTQSLRGENIENALRILSNKSTNEAFGVNSDLEFFFRDRETQKVDTDIDDSNWTNYDIPERGKETLNEVTVVYSDGDERVTVDNSDKLDLQDSLGTERPVGFSDTVVREEIDTFEDAYDLAQQILSDRTETLTGTVTTTADLLDAEPGDTINIEISPRGIDGEFRIAEIQYTEYLTTITIVEKRGNQDDVIVRMSDSIKRVEQRNFDRDGVENKVTSTNIGVETDTTVSPTPDRERLTNTFYNAVADGWRGEGNLDIATIVVGDSNSNLSRTNTDLDNQTDSESATETLVGDTGVKYEATFTSQDIQELGLKDSNGDLYYRATFDENTTITDISIELTVNDNEDFSKGVVTLNGQETVRDIIADNAPDLPDTYAYGSGDTTPDESDTSLATEEFTQDLTEILIQSADTDTDFNEIIQNPAADVPFKIDSGAQQTQICWTTEGEDYDDGQETRVTQPTVDDYSDGDYVELRNDADANESLGFDPIADFAEWNFTVEHTIPADDLTFGARFESDDEFQGGPAINFEFDIDGTTYTVGDLSLGFTAGLTWRNNTDGFVNEVPDEVPPGEHTFRIVVTDSDATVDEYGVWIDAVAPYDLRFESELDFDNTVDTNQGYLDGPEKYSEEKTISLETATTRRNVTTANFDSTWNDTSNTQYVELANDGTSFARVDNASSGSVTFSSPETGVDTNINISRYSETTNQTPKNGNNTQILSGWELFANPDAITIEDTGLTNTQAIIPAGSQTGISILEGGQKSGGVLLTRSLIPEFEILSNMIVLSAERVQFR